MRRDSSCFRGGFILRQVVFVHARDTIFVWSVINSRGFLKISVARRRRNRPLESRRFPRIIGGFWSFEDAVKEVDQERNRRQSKTKRTDRNKDINRLRTSQMIVERRIRDTPHHPVHSQIVHREKRAVKENESQNEMNFAPRFVHQAAKHFREPEIDG